MSIPDPFDAPESATETLPNVQEPNPYRTTVMVEQDSDLMWCVYIDHILRHGAKDYVYVAEFDTKEEADTHAALILAALHEAVME